MITIINCITLLLSLYTSVISKIEIHVKCIYKHIEIFKLRNISTDYKVHTRIDIINLFIILILYILKFYYFQWKPGLFNRSIDKIDMSCTYVFISFQTIHRFVNKSKSHEMRFMPSNRIYCWNEKKIINCYQNWNSISKLNFTPNQSIFIPTYSLKIQCSK